MKLFYLSIALILSFSTGSANAEIQLESPALLMKRAETGRIQLREVILDITKNLPEIRDPRTFDSYFELLDGLQELAVRHRLDEIYPGAVPALGEKMVANGVRWLKIEEDSTDRVLNYHRWMNADIASSFQGEIERESLDEKDPAKLRVLAINTEAVARWAEKRFPDQARMNNNYWRILSDVAGRFLKITTLSEEEIAFWIAKVTYPEPFAMVLEGLQKELFLMNPENRSIGHRILIRLGQIRTQVDAAGNRMPFHIHSMIGEVAVELILRMTKFEEKFAPGEFASALKLLQNRFLQGLGTQWISRNKVPSGEYALEYFSISRALALALFDAGFPSESDQLNAYIGKIAAPIMGRKLDIEGTYELKDKKGKKWKFSLALARETLYFAALNDESGAVHKPFLYVEYDFNSGGFVASAREKDSDPQPIWTLRFKIDGKNIEVTDPWGEPDLYPMKGVKTQSYPDFFTFPPEAATDPAGRYEGVVTFSNNLKSKMTLIVTSFNGYTTARLTDHKNLQLDLNVGSHATNGILYLTTGVKRATWTQLRGIIKNGEYRGVVIIGGREMTKEFVMKKVKE